MRRRAAWAAMAPPVDKPLDHAAALGPLSLLPARSLLAIAAVVDIALHARPQPVAAKTLAARHHLQPRHLETLLQALVHGHILKSVRGPRGGYEPARERRRISVADILRAAAGLAAENSVPPGSALARYVVVPALAGVATQMLGALDAITVDDLCGAAMALKLDQPPGPDFSI